MRGDRGLNKRERGGRGGGGGKLNLCTETDSCGRNASVYHLYPVSRTTGEKRAECSNEREGKGDFQQLWVA